MSWAVRGRSSQVFGPGSWRGPTGRRSIALTFDDGPSAATLEILDILSGYKTPATFFQCGTNVLRTPEITRAVAAAGHEIGNHSHTHPNFAFANAGKVRDEFARAQTAISDACGTRPRVMRPPYGVRWFGFREMQERLGLHSVMWTVIGLDWKLDARAIASRVINAATEGCIICLHDGTGITANPDKSQTIEAVRRIVPALMQQGYHFETVSQLLCPTN